MDLPSDRQLVLRSRRGETKPFGQLVQRYQKSVFNVCYRLLQERRDAEDLTQESFIRAFSRLETFDVNRPFGPWIRRLATNVCLNYLQRKFSMYEELKEERHLSSTNSGNQPEQAELQREEAQRVHAAIKHLAPHYRAVIEMRHFQDLTYAEIAAAMGIPLSDVKSNLYRARQKLVRHLKDD